MLTYMCINICSDKTRTSHHVYLKVDSKVFASFHSHTSVHMYTAKLCEYEGGLKSFESD